MTEARATGETETEDMESTVSLEPTISAVIFDMDGVLVDTEQIWDEVREELTEEWGGRYTPKAQREMMGMSSTEWSTYLHGPSA